MIVDALPRATVDIYGTVRIATSFDVEDATSNIRVITPLLLAKNMPNGVAGLDASSLIYDSYISDNIARVNFPALTGTPTAPTAVVGTNSNQIATTEFVNNQLTTNENIYIMTEGQTIVDISDIWTDTSYKLTCYINRLYSIENTHYTKNTVNKTIILSTPATNGDVIIVIVRPI